MEPKSCYNCKYSYHCYLNIRVEEAVFQFPALGFINVDSIDYNSYRERFFSALAEMCKEYNRKEK